jgi:acyl dehydratase
MVNAGGARMMEVGAVLPEKVFYINRELLKQYADASGDQNPIHQNEEFALSVGLPNVIAHGMLTMALAGKALNTWCNQEFKVIEIFARFTKPVVVEANAPTSLEVSGKIAEITEGKIRVDLTVISNEQKVLGMTRAFVVKA